MGVDLRGISSFERFSLVIMDDCLMKLEHGYSKDRVRRYMYDNVEAVLIWRRFPALRFGVVVLCLIVPGLALLLAGGQTSLVIAFFLLSCGTLILLWYGYHGRTTVRIIRYDKTDEFSGIFTRGKVRRFRERLIENIQKAQQAAISRAEPQTTAEPTVPPIPVAEIAAPEPQQTPPPVPEQAPPAPTQAPMLGI
jgi:hypothetical protein